MQVRLYLPNPLQKEGGPNANFFKLAFGFTEANSEALAEQIVFNPATAVETGVMSYGTKFDQIVEIVGANGHKIPVEFAWIP